MVDLESLVLQALIQHPQWISAVSPELFVTQTHRKAVENLSDDLYEISQQSGLELGYVVYLWEQPDLGHDTFIYRVNKLKEFHATQAYIQELKGYIKRLEDGESLTDVQYEIKFGNYYEE